MKDLLKNILLANIARILYILIHPINFIIVLYKDFKWSRIVGYFINDAIAIDQFGNFNFRTLWNTVLIDKGAIYKFGDFRETISSVMGKNKVLNTLTPVGKLLANILDFIDKDHCVKSIRWFNGIDRVILSDIDKKAELTNITN